MPIPRHDFRPSPPPDHYGLPGVSYPTNDPAAYAVVVEEVPIAGSGYTPLAAYTPHPGTGGATGIAQAILTLETAGKGDGTRRAVRRVYETLPGPPTLTSRIDPEDGAIINEVRRAVRTDTAQPPVATGPVTTRYEARDNSPLVSWQYTGTTDLSNVVRSFPARLNLRLPKVLAGCAVTYNDTGEDGKDASTGGAATTLSTYSLSASSSARSSGSASIIPEPYLPIREDPDETTPAIVKQVYLYGAANETALCAQLTKVYEVNVPSTAAAGTYLGQSSDVNGAVWFAAGTYDSSFFWTPSGYEVKWGAGVWKLGTAAGILAGNYWSRTADATGWLGAYAPHGAASGTATVAAGRTVLPMPTWNTQEVTLTAAGKHAAVSSNASCTENVRVEVGGVAEAKTSGSGFSVASGGNSSRVRIDPTLHGQIIIANPTYTKQVNATAAASITATGGFTGVSASSGFGADSHAQTVQSYVRVGTAPFAVTPAPTTISGNTVASASKTVTAISMANPAVVTFSAAHTFSTGDVVTFAGTDSTPSINGNRVVTFLSTTTASVAVNVTVAGTTGTGRRPTVVTTSTPHGLVTGDIPAITGSNSTPPLNGSGLAMTYLSPTTFSIPVMVTAAGTAGNVQGPAVMNQIGISATEPTDIPRSGLYLDLGYGKSPHDATSIQFLASVVDMTYFAKKPASLEYSDPAPKYVTFLPIIPNQIIFLGGAPTTYALASGSLGGLSLDAATGTISGSPGGGTSTAVISGSNASGTAYASITITAQDRFF